MRNKLLEDEANVFACLLLMPKKIFDEGMAKEIDLADDKWMKEMCKKYDVPMNALAFRISLYKHKNI